MESFPDIRKIKSRTIAFEELNKMRLEKGMQETLRYFFEALNIEPVYKKKERDFKEFYEGRERLKNDPGLIIGNHPGHLDAFLILQVLEGREDFKIFVYHKRVPQFAKILGEDKLISSDDKMGLRKAIHHIENGGVVIFFPTLMEERKTGEILFQRGFKTIAKNLEPETMIYCFNFNLEDMQQAFGSQKHDEFNPKMAAKFSGLNLETIFQSRLANINRYQKADRIRVNEQYTQASEWQNAFSEEGENIEKRDNGKVVDKTSTKHYLEIFDLEK